jgi:isopentenyl-diphosphate delta-isomerase
VYVLLHNSAGLLLLQRRSKRKGVYPGVWDLTVAEHVTPGETYEAAAHRGLREELSIPLVPAGASGSASSRCSPPTLVRTLPPTRRSLRCVTASGPVFDNELVPLYEGLYDGSCAADPQEVAEVRWVAWLPLLAEVEADASAFTPWVLETLRLMGRIG